MTNLLINWWKKLREILKEDFQYIREFALSRNPKLDKSNLTEVGVHHNSWFSESSLYGNDGSTDSKVDVSIEELKSVDLFMRRWSYMV